MLQFVPLCFGLGNFERLKIMVELNLLVEGLLERVIAIEELGLCENGLNQEYQRTRNQITYR